jgi:ssRNA-specific RNase YbeY (16S rRNA maturation enzyme)
MEEVHLRCFSRGGTTDVISLRYDSIPGEPASLAGEVFVNVELAAQATQFGRERELALYIAHGIDHLAGESDADARGRARMRRRELRWLRMAEAADLIEGLLD